MKNSQVQFIQIADQIPYAKITSFIVKEVVYANDAFEIRLDRKCENLPEEKEYRIIRNLADFKWLIEQIKKQSPWVVVLPTLVQSNWSLVDVISLQDQQRVKIRKWYANIHLSRVVERFLKMMNEVVTQNIYKVPGFRRSSLFTFLDRSYQLYRSEKYQESNSKQVQAPNYSPLYSLANSIGKGSMKLLGMFNVIKQDQIRKYLQTEAKSINSIKEHLECLSQLLDGYSKSLQSLPSNFLGEQEYLKLKQKQIYELQLKLDDLNKLTVQILEQINQISKRCEAAEKKGDDKNNPKEQITAYEKFIAKEEKDLQCEFGKIVTEFYEKCLFNEVDIKLKNVYSFKL